MEHAAALGLVELTVAEEGPRLLLRSVLDAPVVEVLVELSLRDRVHRAEPHRDRRVLPEVLELARVRGQTGGLAVDEVGLLLAEPVELLGAHPALEEGTGVHAGGGVALVEDVVAAAGMVLAAEEVVEADLVEGGGGGVGRDVSADLDTGPLCTVDDHRRVPAVPPTVAAFDLFVAGEPGLVLRPDRVDVVGGREAGHPDLLLPGAFEHPQHDIACTGAPAFVDEGVERGQPLLCLLRIDVGHLAGQAVEYRSALIPIVHGVVLSSLHDLHRWSGRVLPGGVGIGSDRIGPRVHRIHSSA